MRRAFPKSPVCGKFKPRSTKFLKTPYCGKFKMSGNTGHDEISQFAASPMRYVCQHERPYERVAKNFGHHDDRRGSRDILAAIERSACESGYSESREIFVSGSIRRLQV